MSVADRGQGEGKRGMMFERWRWVVGAQKKNNPSREKFVEKPRDRDDQDDGEMITKDERDGAAVNGLDGRKERRRGRGRREGRERRGD